MITPNDTNLLVQPAPTRERKAGSIVLPETAEKRGRGVEGHVVDAGPNAGYRKGARVLFSQFSGVNVTLNGIDYVVMEDKEVLGRLDDGVSVG